MHSAVACGCWRVGFEAFVVLGEVAFGINRRDDQEQGTRYGHCQDSARDSLFMSQGVE